MALNFKTSYRFTNANAFENGKTLLGDASVFPNRPANERAVIRAEDYLYLIEGVRERAFVGMTHGSLWNIPAKDTILPRLSLARYDLEDESVITQLRFELSSLLADPSRKVFANGNFNYPVMMSAKVDEVFPIWTTASPTAVKFDSCSKMVAALRSCVESATAYPSSPLPISVEEMTRMYDDLKRMGRVIKGVKPESVSGTTYIVDCSIDKKTGAVTYQTDSFTSSFDGSDIAIITASIIQVNNNTSQVYVAAPRRLPYVENADGGSNCVAWIMLKMFGYGPGGVYYGDGSEESSTYFIVRELCSSGAAVTDFTAIKNYVLKSAGFAAGDSNNTIARKLAGSTLPASTQGSATFEARAKLIGYEMLSGNMFSDPSLTSRQSFFRAAIPPLVTYGRM